jgi:hypothetical protein
MKKIILSAFSLLTLVVCMGLSAHAQQKAGKWSDDDDWGNDHDDNPGVWSAVIHEDKAYVRFGGMHWNSNSTFLLSELGTLPAGNSGTFVVKRDPGAVTFNGSFVDGRGHGTYLFVPDEGFKAYLTGEGFKELSEELMLHLFFTNINKEYLGYMKQNGYDGLTIGELKDLAYRNMNQRVMTGYLQTFKTDGYAKVSVDQIIAMRDHGVSPSFINSFHEMGYKDMSLDQAIKLRDHGVDPDFVQDMKKVGAKDITLDQAIEFRDHGVTVDYVRTLHDAGFPDMSLEKAVELRDHGVSMEFIRSLRDMGYKDISLDEIRELVDHGVNAEFIRGFQRLGFKDISPDAARELRDHGVEPSFVGKFKDIGFADISLEKAVELRDHGVTPDYIKKLQDKGMKNMTLAEYIRLHDAGM